MSDIDQSWECRLAAWWREIDRHQPDDFIASIDALADELAPEDAIGLFEKGAARDSTGYPAPAVAYYRRALASGLTGLRRRRATIQLASSLRNLGNATEAVSLLHAELERVSDELDGAVQAFLALALVDLGREREAVAHSLTALSHYLPRYNRSLANYAKGLVEPSRD